MEQTPKLGPTVSENVEGMGDSNIEREKIFLARPSSEYQESYDRAVAKMGELGERVVETSEVPFDQYWLVDGQNFLGLLQLRHQEAGRFEGLGSHIHYSISPFERGKGYGREILKLGLAEAKKLGLEKVILTCKADNLASLKVIEGSGGKLLEQKQVQGDRGDLLTINKYEIDLKQ